MTLEQTRQLGIEFERRIQTMIPETEFENKLDTETIYSYINQYQDKLIHNLYRTVDQIPTSNNLSYIETLLSAMLTTSTINIGYVADDNNMKEASVRLPDNFGLYVSSMTKVESSYIYKGGEGKGYLTNTLVPHKDAIKAILKPHDNMKILRSPLVWLTVNNALGAVYDRYTEPKQLVLDYYRVPQYMDLMTSTPCELPMEMFDQLVSGAVDLYVQYAAGAEARKRQLQQQQQQQNKQNNEDE